MDEKLQRCLDELRRLREGFAEGLYTEEEAAATAIDTVYNTLRESALGRGRG
jgi:hypothetical protein